MSELTELERAVVEAAIEFCPPEGKAFPIVIAKMERLSESVDRLLAVRAAQGRTA